MCVDCGTIMRRHVCECKCREEWLLKTSALRTFRGRPPRATGSMFFMGYKHTSRCLRCQHSLQGREHNRVPKEQPRPEVPSHVRAID